MWQYHKPQKLGVGMAVCRKDSITTQMKSTKVQTISTVAQPAQMMQALLVV